MWNKVSKTSILVILTVFFFLGTAMAWNEPVLNLNLGNTNVLDAMVPPPGVYLETYTAQYHSDEFKDANGQKLPFHNEMSLEVIVPQFVWVPKKKITNNLRLGVMALVPIANVNMDSDLGLTANNDNLGDLCIGPFIYGIKPITLGNGVQLHWVFEFDTYFPTGSYDKHKTINPSSNLWSFDPWISFTLIMPHGFSFSTRQQFTYNTTNNDYLWKDGRTYDLQPGMCYNFNYSIMKTVDFISPRLRLGIVGYYEKQLTEDQLDDSDMNNSKEQVFAIGPAIHYITKGGVVISLKNYFESKAENRPEGVKFVGRIVFRF